MSKIAVLHAATTPAAAVEALARELNAPYELHSVSHVTDLQRFIRQVQARKEDYLCVINACTGSDSASGDVSAAFAALLLDKASIPYTGCRAVCLGYPLDALLMMIRYAPVSLPRYREVRCREDVPSAAAALHAPVRIVSMTPCLGCVDRVVSEADEPVLTALTQCQADYGPLIVFEHAPTYSGGVDVLVCGRTVISAPRDAHPEDSPQVHDAVACCETAARHFAKNVLYYRGTALLSFAPSNAAAEGERGMDYNLVHLTLHCPLFDLPPSLQAKVPIKTFLSDLVQQALDLHPKPGYKMHLMEGEQSRMGYIMVAAQDFAEGQVVFADECRSFAMVTRPHVEKYWDAETKKTFTEYAWPLDSDGHLYAMWEEDPARWRPLNHSCDPNCIFAAPHSLNVVAARNIKAGDNLTMDYATFCDHTMKPFECFCGASCCRGRIIPDEASLLKYGDNTWLRKVPGPVNSLV